MIISKYVRTLMLHCECCYTHIGHGARENGTTSREMSFGWPCVTVNLLGKQSVRIRHEHLAQYLRLSTRSQNVKSTRCHIAVRFAKRIHIHTPLTPRARARARDTTHTGTHRETAHEYHLCNRIIIDEIIVDTHEPCT